MSNKLTSIGTVSLLVIGVFLGFITLGPGIVSAAGLTLYVDDDNVAGPWDGSIANPFQTINDAITVATNGDTIIVFNGTYVENVVVDKSLTITGNGTENTTIDGSWSGDAVWITANMVNITGFTITNGSTGIFLDSSSGHNIINNNISSNSPRCISLLFSSNNNITNNNLSDTGTGVLVESSSDNIITANNFSNTNYGIYLKDSSDCTVLGNDFTNGGIFLWANTLSGYDSHTITPDNMVDGDPIYYYKDINGLVIDGIPVGQLILVNCSDMNVKNLQINDTAAGIEMAYTHNTNITGNNITNNYYGITPVYSSNNNISNNDIFDSQYGLFFYHSSDSDIIGNDIFDGWQGIYFDGSWGNEIIGNNVSSFTYHGIQLSSSSNCNITGNEVFSNGQRGIYLSSSSDCDIIGNNISSNGDMGIEVYSSSNTDISSNTITNDGLFFWGGVLSHFNSHTVPTSNMVNGKPLYYYKDTNNLDIDGITAGQIILANCNDANVTNMEINDTDVGIQVAYCQNANVSGNHIFDNDFGLYYSYSDFGTIYNNEVETHDSNAINMFFSENNIVTKNNVTQNSGFGIYLSFSNQNNITWNDASWNIQGIYPYSSNGNTIDNNTASNNTESGIHIYFGCKNNIITNNTAEDNDIGIYIIAAGTIDNLVAHNFITRSTTSGVYLNSVNNNTVSDNNISSNRIGIAFASSYANTIVGNTITNSSDEGINMGSSSTDNTISYNTIANNPGMGINLQTSADKNVITYNDINNNTLQGIWIFSANNNTIHHNNIAYNKGSTSVYNPANVQASDNGVNFWNTSDKGNWWADWTTPDIEPNGIVDNPYILDGGSGQDNFPLVNPVDAIPPVISNLQPSIGITLVINITTIAADYSDPAGINVNSVVLEVDDVDVTISSIVTASDISYTTPSALADGIHTVNLSVADIHDNYAFESWSFNIDTTSPEITNLQPSDGSATNDNTTSISANYTDLSGIDVGSIVLKVNGIDETSSADVTPDGISYSPPTPWTDGTYTIELLVNDTLSNNATTSWSFTVDTISPEAITDLVASDPTTESINLTWTAPGDDDDSGTAEEYEVKYSISGPITEGNWNSATRFSQSWTPLAAGETETYVISGLGQDTQYWFAIKAFDEVSNTADISNSPDETTLVVKTEPTAPQIHQATWGDSYINITWLAPSSDGNSPIINYSVYRGTSPNSEIFYRSIGNVLFFNDTGLDNGATYYYKVSAVNGIGEGPLSGEAHGTPATTPSAPQNLQATAGDGYVDITWNAPSDNGGSAITHYGIYRNTTSGVETFLKQVGNVRHYNDTTVTNGVTYYYLVKAKNALGEGSISSEISATPTAPVNQPPTSNITSISSGATVKGTVTISGSSDDTDGTIERVEMKIDGESWFNVTGTTSWSYNLDTTTLSNGEHTIYIRSYDGESYSEESSVSLQVDNPSPKEEKSPLEESWFFLVIVLIVIVIIVVLLLVMKGKKGPAEDEIPDEVEEQPEEIAPGEEAEELEEEPLEETPSEEVEEPEEETPEETSSEENEGGEFERERTD